LGRPVKPGDDNMKAAQRPGGDIPANTLVLSALLDRIINSTAF
jgi:hypothetical protein